MIRSEVLPFCARWRPNGTAELPVALLIGLGPPQVNKQVHDP